MSDDKGAQAMTITLTLEEAPGDSGNEFARAIEAKLKEKNT